MVFIRSSLLLEGRTQRSCQLFSYCLSSRNPHTKYKFIIIKYKPIMKMHKLIIMKYKPIIIYTILSKYTKAIRGHFWEQTSTYVYMHICMLLCMYRTVLSDKAWHWVKMTILLEIQEKIIHTLIYRYPQTLVK